MTTGRIPPHDLDAEASVLSAIMLDPFALDLALGVLEREHFYSEHNGAVYAVCVELAAEGTPVDVTTVAALLRRQERLSRIGGTAYLVQIADATPAVGNVEAHAAIVRDHWRARKMIEAGHQIVATGYGDHGPHEDWIEGCEREVFAVASQSKTVEDEHIADIMRRDFANIEEASRNGGTLGRSTGLRDLDKAIGGLVAGELIIGAGRPAMGKAQPLTCRVLTPSGWREMGSLCVGDSVMGPSGRPVVVRAVHERGSLPTWRVTTSDGGTTLCCGDHLWLTSTRNDRRAGRAAVVRDTREIAATVERPGGGANHVIPLMHACELDPQPEPNVSPWVLGVWIGDGARGDNTVRISNVEADIRDRVRTELNCDDELSESIDGTTIRVTGGTLRQELRRRGLLNLGSHDRFIPTPYLHGSTQTRLAVLRGLVDTDGHVVRPSGRLIEYTTTSRRLRDDLRFLVGTLGGVSSVTETIGAYKDEEGHRHECRAAYRVRFWFPRGDVVPFTSAKHRARWKVGPGRVQQRFIQTVEPGEVLPCRCITVDGGLYVTEDFLVTHNSALAGNVAEYLGDKGLGTCVFTGEMPSEQYVRRIVCSRGDVDMRAIRQGRMRQDDWTKLTATAPIVARMPIFVDSRCGLTPEAIRANVRRRKAKLSRDGVELALVVVDYLQLLSGSGAGKGTPREQQVAHISRELKKLAKECGVTVLALSQLNRGVESRDNKRPNMSDIRESGQIEQDADVILLLYRHEYYDDECGEDLRGVVEIDVAKQRDGSTGRVLAHFEARRTRFSDLHPESASAYLNAINGGSAPGRGRRAA